MIAPVIALHIYLEKAIGRLAILATLMQAFVDKGNFIAGYLGSLADLCPKLLERSELALRLFHDRLRNQDISVTHKLFVLLDLMVKQARKDVPADYPDILVFLFASGTL